MGEKLNRIAKRLDLRLDDISLFHELTEAESKEFAFIDGVVGELEKNMSINGTTESNIARAEGDFLVTPDNRKTLQDRVSILLAKLRGVGTTTPAMVKNLARSFEYGEIEIDEESKEDVLIIRFTSIYGTPPNMVDFIAALTEILPAHLLLEFIYKYLTWNDYESYNRTWDEWDALNLTWDELEVYNSKSRGVV